MHTRVVISRPNCISFALFPISLSTTPLVCIKHSAHIQFMNTTGRFPTLKLCKYLTAGVTSPLTIWWDNLIWWDNPTILSWCDFPTCDLVGQSYLVGQSHHLIMVWLPHLRSGGTILFGGTIPPSGGTILLMVWLHIEGVTGSWWEKPPNFLQYMM